MQHWHVLTEAPANRNYIDDRPCLTMRQCLRPVIFSHRVNVTHVEHALEARLNVGLVTTAVLLRNVGGIVAIVYLFTCGCGTYYVGKMKKTFWKWINVTDISTGILDSPIVVHFPR